MKNHKIRFVILTAVYLCGVSNGFSQSTFQNLDFEAATVPQNQMPGIVNVTAALPDWNVFYGAVQQSQVLFNDETVGTTSISLLGTSGVGPPPSVEGGYSVLLQGYFTAPGASISQTAIVPVSAESIMFKAVPAYEGTLLVSLGGQNISFVNLAAEPNYTLYGGNIPAGLAGQLEELQFLASSSTTGPNNWELDSIVFSPSPVPEPTTIVLGILGVFSLAFCCRRKPHKGAAAHF